MRAMMMIITCVWCLVFGVGVFYYYYLLAARVVFVPSFSDILSYYLTGRWITSHRFQNKQLGFPFFLRLYVVGFGLDGLGLELADFGSKTQFIFFSTFDLLIRLK